MDAAPTTQSTLHITKARNGAITGARLDIIETSATDPGPTLRSQTFDLGALLPNVKVHGPPPTINDTIQLFTLSEDQALTFARLGIALVEEAAGRQVRGHDPIRAWVTGGPGMGKTQALSAFEWFAFQHDKLHWVGKCAYTWRAASNISKVDNVAISTSRFFRINTMAGNKLQADQTATIERIRDVRFVLVDEFSFIDLRHFFVSIPTRRSDLCRAAHACKCADDEIWVVSACALHCAQKHPRCR